MGGARRLRRVGNRGPEEGRVGPLGDDLGNARDRRRIERRLGRHPVEDPAHERGIAIDIGADLHERRSPVAARERDTSGLGNMVGTCTERQRRPFMPRTRRTFSENGELG
jgi:hypothetical protein